MDLPKTVPNSPEWPFSFINKVLSERPASPPPHKEF
ncbi:unnamed protein product [Arabidopsis arenosa]|uniref:Uncharacterized protein n=1 Tax=Arabidopsis arenosa TaxID=38785 RepID=A0A8S2AFA5_ARAAE|nr:unnamed protein product [Arabidopsis arenosa]